MDESHKRDVLSKVDFNQDPNEVYKATKIAIRDICGLSGSSASDQVYFTKPWHQQDRHRSRSRSWSRSSRDRSRSRENYRDRSRGFSGDGKSPRRDSGGNSYKDSRAVSFSRRRHPTPIAGIFSDKSVCNLSVKYDEVLFNDEDFSKCLDIQYMIVDIGSPRSLMGEHEYFRLRGAISEGFLNRIKEYSANERFRFGPSKVYSAVKRVEVPIKIKDKEIFAKFYVIEGNVPILIGNDILEPLGGVIDTGKRFITFKRLNRYLDLIKTSGGHYVLPVCRKSPLVDEGEMLSNKVSNEESSAVMLATLAGCEDIQYYRNFHDTVGHEMFVSAMLEESEVKEVQKVHRYFCHRAGRKVWKLFAKAG